MQLAARRVVWENCQLRDLLARNGISTSEIEAFLHGQRDKTPHDSSGHLAAGGSGNIAAQWCESRPSYAPPAAIPTHKSFPAPRGQRLGTGDPPTIDDVDGQSVVGTPAGEPNKRAPRRSSGAQEPMRRESAQPVSIASSHSAFAVKETRPQPHSPSSCFSPAPPTSASNTEGDSTLEMSCQIAAEIISGMRGNRDQEQTRLQLGCAGHELCNVKNIAVLQLMAMD
jgi:hypothetical protein